MGYYINTKGEKIDGSKYKVVHPEGQIQLIDGTLLPCYEKKDGNDTAIDKVEEGRLLKLFTDNAFYLLAHRKRILSDSRMFLCPIAVKSGLSISGTSGFQNPTLGIYLEWWNECPGAMINDDSGRSLVYRLAGSALSGGNSSSRVDENGESHGFFLHGFSGCCWQFMGINTRYANAKRRYQCYTLQQVLDTLHREDNGDCDFSQALNTTFMQHEINSLNKRVEELSQQSKMWREKYIDTLLLHYDARIREYYKEYEILESISQTEIDNLREQKRNLKASLKRGEMDNITYQRTLTPINKRIEGIDFKLSRFRYEHLHKTFPGEDDLNFEIIKQYMDKNKLKNENSIRAEQEVMTIIVRCLFHKAVTPTCDILCLGKDEWHALLAADPKQRMRMVLTKLHKTYLIGAVKEMLWIPYDHQDIIKIVSEM